MSPCVELADKTWLAVVEGVCDVVRMAETVPDPEGDTVNVGDAVPLRVCV